MPQPNQVENPIGGESKGEKPFARKRIPPRDWEGAVEKTIREAMERGDFDNLPGQGKPLDLTRDPNVPADWETAYRMLQEAGFAPEWIEMHKEIRAAREKLFAPLQRYLERVNEPQRERAAREERLSAEFRKQAAELNRLIDTFNLKAPSPRVHQPRVRVEEEIQKFRDACARAQE